MPEVATVQQRSRRPGDCSQRSVTYENDDDASLVTTVTRRDHSHLLGYSTTTTNTKKATSSRPTFLLNWRETLTAVLLVLAFGSCVSVFVLLGQSSEATTSSRNVVSEHDWEGVQCDVHNPRNHKVLSYLLGDTPQNNNNYYISGRRAPSSDAMDENNETTSCRYNVHICPATSNSEEEERMETIMFILLVGALLTVMGVTVLFYDDNEHTNHSNGSKKVTMSHHNNNDKSLKSSMHSVGRYSGLARRSSLTSVYNGGNNSMTDASEYTWASASRQSGPIADLFTDVTLLFGDIEGFDAWSSQREPTQCLTLLETVYGHFDKLAKQQGIFKVEAVADCYTAAAGLPEFREDHAEAIVRFAKDCLKSFKDTTKALEVELGPETADLALRLGIHSGPVTALRGGRSRFQLFGDTVSMATSLLNASQGGFVHVSGETRELLPASMKTPEWVHTPARDHEDTQPVPGCESFWLTLKKPAGLKRSITNEFKEAAGQSEDVTETTVNEEDKFESLVNWNVQILLRVLNQIVTRREAIRDHKGPSFSLLAEKSVDARLREGKLVIDEVEEVIALPRFDAEAAKAQDKARKPAEVSKDVVQQLHDYIALIGKSYRNNPFHNFEHASHVMMSVGKLLSRILAPKMKRRSSGRQSIMAKVGKKELHDHTYGITSDPLTQFACMFSALIHDAEHDGVPNAQLVKECTPLAAKYRNQSVAEQNSVDVAWSLLLEDRFQDLRNAIYETESEMVHFRQLVVNCVMATDICDKQLKELRNKRWERAFKKAGMNDSQDIVPSSSESDSDDEARIREEDVNRKATIVIEHLLQASDVSHTMQHFNVFTKWNEKLFMEMYFAFRDGRSVADPSKFWYKGEIGFFDFYIIPLAKKLKECGVFGVSSDEYLNYATKNRAEWESKGHAIVQTLIQKAEKAYEIRQQKNKAMQV